jgi:hypothetical protein
LPQCLLTDKNIFNKKKIEISFKKKKARNWSRLAGGEQLLESACQTPFQ